jgi:hypothetical protein
MLHSFPAWFAGVTFAAIGIGALVPAAIMSIAAANLFTRNVYRECRRQRPAGIPDGEMGVADRQRLTLRARGQATWAAVQFRTRDSLSLGAYFTFEILAADNAGDARGKKGTASYCSEFFA